MKMRNCGQRDSVKRNLRCPKDSAAGCWASQAMCTKLRSTDESSRRRWCVNCLVDANAIQRMKGYSRRQNMGGVGRIKLRLDTSMVCPLRFQVGKSFPPHHFQRGREFTTLLRET